MSRRTCVAVIAVTAVLALVGCGSQGAAGGASPSGSAPSPTASGSAAPPASTDPVSLVGSWLVRDDATVEDGTVLRISDDLSLWASCGYVSGGWRADHHGLFVGHIDGGDGGCMPKQGDQNVFVSGILTSPPLARESIWLRTASAARLSAPRTSARSARLSSDAPSRKTFVRALTVLT